MEKKLISRALPSFYYDDPAVVCERLEAKRMGCKVCSYHRVVLGKIVCGHDRNEKQYGVPWVGLRCRWFNEQG